MVHRFDEKLAEGKACELELDQWFGQWFDITPATRQQDRDGIDRWFQAKKFPLRLAVQYKKDAEAAKYKNLFLEVVSVDTANKPGWAIKCDAEWLCIYIPKFGDCYIISTYMLKTWIPCLAMKYPMRESANDGYLTHGVCVPLNVIKEQPFLIGIMKKGVVDGGNQTSFSFT